MTYGKPVPLDEPIERRPIATDFPGIIAEAIHRRWLAALRAESQFTIVPARQPLTRRQRLRLWWRWEVVRPARLQAARPLQWLANRVRGEDFTDRWS